jgi:hypothetical protein
MITESGTCEGYIDESCDDAGPTTVECQKR